MSMINYASREINCKLVYYGPGLGGKTTNLEFVYNKVAPGSRGKMISLATETERTLFFDFLPVDLGTIRGFKVKFHLYTVPGQVYYNASRKLILKGVDGVVFVADSQIERMDANIEAMQNLYENMTQHGYDLTKIPVRHPVQQARPPQRRADRRAAGGAQSRAGRWTTRPSSASTARSAPRVRVSGQPAGRPVDRAGALLRGGGAHRRRRVRHPQGHQQERRQDAGVAVGMWTLPNIITLVRICFTPVIALLPFIEGYWPKLIAFVIFLAAADQRHLRRPPRPQPERGHRPRQAARPHRRQAAALRHADPDLLDLPLAPRSLRHPDLGQHPALGLPAAHRPGAGHDRRSAGGPAGAAW